VAIGPAISLILFLVASTHAGFPGWGALTLPEGENWISLPSS